jgi:ribonuclease HI
MAAPFRAAVDGGARGNPGPAAWAVVVFDGGFEAAVEAHAGFLGRATNNVAEYRALLHALRLAQECGARDVAIRGDSELIVRQVRGTYKVKHPDLKPLHAEALERIRAFAKFEIAHVRREANREADRYVNRVLDMAARGEDVSDVLRERLDTPAASS